MNFTHFDLGSLEQGRIVRVTLEGNAANVLLLDDGSYRCYLEGEPYQYTGGFVNISPVHFQTPQAGHWHIAVHLQGLGGTVNASVTLLAPGTSAVSNLISPNQMYNNGNGVREVSRRDMPLKSKYDVFIAYVSEDKREVARPLAQLLAQRGVRAGFEEFELKANGALWDILDRTSDFRYGIFILSQNFIQRNWRKDELNAIVSKITGGRTSVFPIWHNISEKDMRFFSPELEKKPARYTGYSSMERIADELAANIPH